MNGVPARAPAPPDRVPRDPARPDRAASRHLPAGPEAAAAARDFTSATLARWGMHDVTTDAVVIASELTANASTAAHAAGFPLNVSLHDRPPELRIYIWDHGPGHPPLDPTPAAADAESGRGLTIVNALSTNWNWFPTPHSGGKVVWASLTVPPPG